MIPARSDAKASTFDKRGSSDTRSPRPDVEGFPGEQQPAGRLYPDRDEEVTMTMIR